MVLGAATPNDGMGRRHGTWAEVDRLRRRTLDELRTNGPVKVATEAAKFAQSQVMCRVAPRCRRPGTFEFMGRQLAYVRRPYNHSWRNERSVEVPIALDFIDRLRPGRLLEFGNVLSYYRPTLDHDVVDKYEREPGVINEDIETFRPAQPYDALVSISTLEHVGWDEEPRRPEKVLLALDRLVTLVASGSPMLVTTPLGHNPTLDAALAAGEAPFAVQRWMHRVSAKNEWAETTAAEALATPYERRASRAGAIFVGLSASPSDP